MLLSGRNPTGQEMLIPLEVRNWLLLVECMMRRCGERMGEVDE